MRKIKLNIIILIYLLPFFSIISQENNFNIKEKNIYSPQAGGGPTITFKNSVGTSLAAINDETDINQTFGSLSLTPAIRTPSNSMDNKIWISSRGDLMYGDSPLAGWWTLSGSILTFPTGLMVLGTSLNPASTPVLNVLGRATIKSLKLTDGNEGDGKVLVSDANGIGSWQEFSSGGSIDELFDGKATESSVYLGYYAGNSDIDVNTQNANVGVGVDALYSADSDVLRNTAVGYSAMKYNTSGLGNAAFGYEAFKGSDFGPANGDRNTALGSGALRNNTDGSGNIAIGFEAGKSSSGDNKLYIHNSDAGSSSLIYGDFQNAELEINGQLTVLQGIYGTVYGSSDNRYKKNIEKLSNSLDKVLKLRGVSYNWRINEFPDKNFNDRKQIGVIAQEMEKVIPEVVHTDKDGYKSVEYSKLAAVLIEAIKEQQEMIEELRNEIKEVKSSKSFIYSSN